MTRAPDMENIRLLLLDVDGVLTDGRIVIDDNGLESKFFHVRDGLGLRMLMRAGIEIGVITGRRSGVVEKRMAELGVQLVHQGVKDKTAVFENIQHNKKEIRFQLSKMIGKKIRKIPELVFYLDEGAEHASKMDEIFRNLQIPPEEDDQ